MDVKKLMDSVIDEIEKYKALPYSTESHNKVISLVYSWESKFPGKRIVSDGFDYSPGEIIVFYEDLKGLYKLDQTNTRANIDKFGVSAFEKLKSKFPDAINKRAELLMKASMYYKPNDKLLAKLSDIKNLMSVTNLSGALDFGSPMYISFSGETDSLNRIKMEISSKNELGKMFGKKFKKKLKKISKVVVPVAAIAAAPALLAKVGAKGAVSAVAKKTTSKEIAKAMLKKTIVASVAQKNPAAAQLLEVAMGTLKPDGSYSIDLPEDTPPDIVQAVDTAMQAFVGGSGLIDQGKTDEPMPTTAVTPATTVTPTKTVTPTIPTTPAIPTTPTTPVTPTIPGIQGIPQQYIIFGAAGFGLLLLLLLLTRR